MKVSLLRNLGQSQPTSTGRETFSSLRATRGAIRIARDFLFRRPIDIDHARCEKCGTSVDRSIITATRVLYCPQCGHRMSVPGYPRSRVEWDGNQPRFLDSPSRRLDIAKPFIRAMAFVLLAAMVGSLIIMLLIGLTG